MSRSLLAPAALVIVVALTACGGGGGGDSTAPPTAGPPASLTVSLPAPTLTLGDSARATATVRDAKGAVLSGATVTWASSARNVVDVNATTGMLYGRALDTATIVATASGISGSASVRVRPPTAVTVSMLPQAYVPFSFVLAVGGTVTYDFPPGIQHNVIFPKRANGQPLVTGAPNDILPAQNQKITRTFNTAGTFTYDCTIHPGMTGEVIVVP